MSRPEIFDARGIRDGALKILPLALGVLVYGAVYGVLAGQAGVTVAEAVALSGLVFAGASQFVALDMWVEPLPVAAIIATTIAVNLRHVLMGAAMSPYLCRIKPHQAYISVFFMVDEGWALSLAEFQRGYQRVSFLLGTGLTLYAAWLSSTLFGITMGNLLPAPETYGIDFAFTAMFIALLALFWRGKGDLPPWIVAGVAAVAAEQLLPGKWYIIIGGLAGAVTGMARHGR